jgi:hypothetical protein
VTSRRFSSGTPVSSINKTDLHDVTEILLKVALSTIKPNQTNQLIERISSELNVLSTLAQIYVIPGTDFAISNNRNIKLQRTVFTYSMYQLKKTYFKYQGHSCH